MHCHRAIRLTCCALFVLAQIAMSQARTGKGEAAPSSSMFRGDLAHTGAYDGPAITALPKVKWAFKTGGAIFSSPAIVENLAYIGSTDGNLYALDISDGRELWKFATKGRIVSSPAVANGTVFIESYDGKLYAIDARTGEQKWVFATGGERRFNARHIHGLQPDAESMPDPFDFYLSSPAVANGLVYFGSGDGNVYAVDAAIGALKWKFTTGDVVHASPAVAGGLVLVGSWDTNFYALDAATGAERWRFKTGDDENTHNQTGIQSSAAVADGIVYFGCRDSKLYALDLKTGRQLWAYNNKGSWVIGSPAVKDGTVYFATSDSALFHAVDAKTGEERFSLTFAWPMFSSPTIAGQFVYLGSHEGKLLAIDVAARKLAWTFQTDASKQNGPALTLPDGKPNYRAAMASPFYEDIVVGIHKMFSVGAILSSPAVVGGVIYIGSADGALYALQ